MIEDVAMEKELASDDRIAEVHQEVERTRDAFPTSGRAVGNDEAVGPKRVFDGYAVDLLDQEVELVDVKVVHLLGDVHDVPLFDGADVDHEHRLGLRRIRLSVDEKLGLRILAKNDDAFHRGRRVGRRLLDHLCRRGPDRHPGRADDYGQQPSQGLWRGVAGAHHPTKYRLPGFAQSTTPFSGEIFPNSCNFLDSSKIRV